MFLTPIIKALFFLKVCPILVGCLDNFGEIITWKQVKVYFLSVAKDVGLNAQAELQILSWLYCLSTIERGHLNRTLGKTNHNWDLMDRVSWCDLKWKAIAYNFISIHVNLDTFEMIFIAKSIIQNHWQDWTCYVHY